MSQTDMLPDRFHAALFTTMQHLGPKFVEEMEIDLTPGQVFMLRFISKQQNCTASILAEKMEVNPSAVTVMLDRLEHHNFVVRRRSEKDRRMIVLELTETGREALQRVMETRRRILAHCFNQLRPDEPKLLVELLEHLAEVASVLDVKEVLSSALSAEDQIQAKNAPQDRGGSQAKDAT